MRKYIITDILKAIWVSTFLCLVTFTGSTVYAQCSAGMDCGQIHQAGWFEGHSEMSFLDPLNPADMIMHDAMGTLTSTGKNNSQVTQVCRGVYLGVAHALMKRGDTLDDLITKRAPKIDAYPFGTKPEMYAYDIISLRLGTIWSCPLYVPWHLSASVFHG